MKECQECIFWKRVEETGYGLCHRYPPTAVIDPRPDGNPRPAFYFPNMPAASWCGEFKTKVVPQFEPIKMG